MNIIFDFEVFAYDWIVVFRAVGQDQYYVIHNDNEKLKYFMSQHPDDIFFGYNIKHYDNYIMKAIIGDGDVTQVKGVNDRIILDGIEGYKISWLKNVRFNFNYCDLMDDTRVGLSLKEIEAHLGMDIEESNVDFNINRELTDDELSLTIQYCKFDVDATLKLYELRKPYIDNKIMVGKMAGLSESESLKMTNAKLTAEYLQAEPKETHDERQYVYPSNLLREYIPQEVFDFYDRMYDPSVSDEELFHSQYKSSIGNCNYTLGFGGIHGDCGKSIVDATQDNIVIINEDVGSYYPHLITINGYTSRAMQHPDDYAKMLDKRMKAKVSGDKITNQALKLVCNTTFGSYGDKYNKLHDPLMMRSVCISGQLYLLELAMHCYKETECDIVQLNTDGIMLATTKELLPKIEEICAEWQQRTHFELEKDSIVKVIQKDVNNYIEIKDDGSFKCKGGYLVRGLSQAGAFNVNNNYSIVSKAVVDYFTKGISPEETIINCNDIFKFQIIAKAGGKYSKARHEIDGNLVEVQKCNRVYASNRSNLGTLYKIHKQTNKPSKIANLPTHCIVDNKNKLSISDVNKKWYIDLAWKYINDYLGDDNMAATTKKPNIYEKLMLARQEFGVMDKKKSGENDHAHFEYYELKDIIPSATKVFTDLGLAFYTTFSEAFAHGYLIDTESGERLEFNIPLVKIAEPGKFRQNEIQAMGGAVTYYRRYMYMLVLDITEPDAYDPFAGIDPSKLANPEPDVTPKKAKTSEERKEIKAELTTATEQADETHINALKNILSTVKKKKPDMESVIQKVVIDTNKFTTLTNEQAEAYIKQFNRILKGENDD